VLIVSGSVTVQSSTQFSTNALASAFSAEARCCAADAFRASGEFGIFGPLVVLEGEQKIKEGRKEGKKEGRKEGISFSSAYFLYQGCFAV
jgi:hypothetical protein